MYSTAKIVPLTNANFLGKDKYRLYSDTNLPSRVLLECRDAWLDICIGEIQPNTSVGVFGRDVRGWIIGGGSISRWSLPVSNPRTHVVYMLGTAVPVIYNDKSRWIAGVVGGREEETALAHAGALGTAIAARHNDATLTTGQQCIWLWPWLLMNRFICANSIPRSACLFPLQTLIYVP